MDFLLQYIPMNVVIAAGFFSGAAVIIMILFIISNSLVKYRMQNLHRYPEALHKLVLKTQQHPSLRRVNLLLQYAPEDGLFAVFMAALKSRRCAHRFRTWLDHHEDVLSVRKVALSGKGESFDGAQAAEFFRDRMDQIRELAGHPEWAVRYMAEKILLHDNDKRSRRALQDAFHDPHSLVRRTAAEEFAPEDSDERELLYTELTRLLKDDFVFEVRAAAKQRLGREFSDRDTLDTDSLTPVQILHVVEQLNRDSTADHDIGLRFLGHDNLEIHLQAARYAARAGLLSRLFQQADNSDSTARAHTQSLLMHAASVGESGFLYRLRDKTDLSPASLEVAAEILKLHGPVYLIPYLLRRAAKADPALSAMNTRVYTLACACACRRGDAASATELASLLREHRYNERYLSPIFQELNGTHPQILVPALLDLLQDTSFPLRYELETAIQRFDHGEFIQQLLDIVTADRILQPHPVRISAFLIIGRLQLPFTLQTILEHLPILPVFQAREFSSYLAEHNGEEFTRRVLDILNGEDGKVRAAVIAAVSTTGNKEFIKPIRNAATDADPLVRSAAAWALIEYGDTRSVKEARGLLRDPVTKVREQAAQALGASDNDDILSDLAEICSDANEVMKVRKAAILGLENSSKPDATQLLAEQLINSETPKEFQQSVIDALSGKTGVKEIEVLVTKIKDSDPETRERLTQVFRRMGQSGEEALIELLHEDIASLRPYITSILEETGYIDATVRLISHRDPQVRQTAAEQLSVIGTAAAFRGIVVAASDPDTEVRVKVTRALERLASPAGKEILDELQNDPDKRIRKYTLWALERIKAGKLTEE